MRYCTNNHHHHPQVQEMGILKRIVIFVKVYLGWGTGVKLARKDKICFQVILMLLQIASYLC